MLKCRHIMSNSKKKIYRVLKKGIYGFACINDPVYDCEKDRVVTTDEENPKIVLQKGEIDKIVSFFYHTYKGERARKMQPRIKRFYTGISIKRIPKSLNSNESHFKTNPIFSNKPPISPVVSKTIQGCNQIDLVDMRSMSVTNDGVEYNSSVKWGHLAHLELNSINTIISTNPMGSSSPL